MRYVYEFEIFEDEGLYLAYLFDFDQMTQGDDFADAIDMSVDLLRFMIEDYLVRGTQLPSSTFDHKPRNGGRLVAVSVDVDFRESEEFITAKETSIRLGVTQPRVSHLLRDGVLHGYKDRGNTFITVESVEAYKKQPRRRGRPKEKLPDLR